MGLLRLRHRFDARLFCFFQVRDRLHVVACDLVNMFLEFGNLIGSVDVIVCHCDTEALASLGSNSCWVCTRLRTCLTFSCSLVLASCGAHHVQVMTAWLLEAVRTQQSYDYDHTPQTGLQLTLSRVKYSTIVVLIQSDIKWTVGAQ